VPWEWRRARRGPASRRRCAGRAASGWRWRPGSRLCEGETELPGRYVSSTIRTLSSVDQRRRRGTDVITSTLGLTSASRSGRADEFRWPVSMTWFGAFSGLPLWPASFHALGDRRPHELGFRLAPRVLIHQTSFACLHGTPRALRTSARTARADQPTPRRTTRRRHRAEPAHHPPPPHPDRARSNPPGAPHLWQAA
jgi:hypothetical protein